MQKEVLAIGVNYAMRLVTFSRASPNHKISKPSPPLVIVHGGAGSGKSRVINCLYNMMTHILQKEGDDPSCPYVVLTSFTGAASANINGQTLHSLFGFKFGTSFLSMSERQRANKRLLFRDLKCVVIDEISMVSADLFYNLDLRLREITVRDIPFGGLSVFVFGDLFQLQPPKARYVFEPPCNKEHALAYSLRNLWKLFKVVNLVENHRQGKDKAYGDLLNRVRAGFHTKEDIALLETRIRPKSDPILKNGLHIYGTNAKVNARNDSKLEEIDGELFTIKAKNASRTVKTFKTNNAGCIKNTPFLAVLKLKIGCEVVLVHNVNTLDGLTNGCRGVLLDVEKTGDAVKRLVVKFNNPNHGRLQRQKNPCKKHPEGTYIDPIHWQYFLGGAVASVVQFPMKGAGAISSHKIQASEFLTNLNVY
jgi:ATP-dependent DNA helicase PIF1